MINLIQGDAKRTLQFHNGNPKFVGMLRTPRGSCNPQNAVDLDMLWAMDNGCFKRYEPDKIIQMMSKYRHVPNCIFMVSPDVVGSHDETMILFRLWHRTIELFGFPVAFVLQDGVTLKQVPFDNVDAIFIGGTTEFKFSDIVRQIVKEAKKRNKWVHCGRVNTINRLQYIKSIGCDSFDGTRYTRFMSWCTSHPKYYANERRQMNLWELIE